MTPAGRASGLPLHQRSWQALAVQQFTPSMHGLRRETASKDEACCRTTVGCAPVGVDGKGDVLAAVGDVQVQQQADPAQAELLHQQPAGRGGDGLRLQLRLQGRLQGRQGWQAVPAFSCLAVAGRLWAVFRRARTVQWRWSAESRACLRCPDRVAGAAQGPCGDCTCIVISRSKSSG